MTNLNAEGKRVVADIAARHGISIDAATHMLVAVAAGHGTQAQFNHPELGGMGQWSQGGMTMVGDMFNNSLKAKVDNLCSELSGVVAKHGAISGPQSSQSQSQGTGYLGSGLTGSGVSLFVQEASDWPAELGRPSSVGAQNDMRYAFFPEQHRLAIRIGGHTTVYDTLDHQIGGFGQAQSGGQSLTFTSQHGLVCVADLPIVGPGQPARPAPLDPATKEPTATRSEPTAAPETPSQPAQAEPVAPASRGMDSQTMTDDQIFSRIERLAGLFEKGILSEGEYETKKAELLSRL